MLQRCKTALIHVNAQRLAGLFLNFATNPHSLAAHAQVCTATQTIRCEQQVPWPRRRASMTETLPTTTPDISTATAPGAAPVSGLPQFRTYLMCPPDHFAVQYSINPWMASGEPVDTARAMLQWQLLRDTYRSLGHSVELIDARLGLPDMVFAANGATVIGGTVLGSQFRHPERAAEGPAYLDWFRGRGFTSVHEPRLVNEGEGDIVHAGRVILAGHGFRSDPEVRHE